MWGKEKKSESLTEIEPVTFHNWLDKLTTELQETHGELHHLLGSYDVYCILLGSAMSKASYEVHVYYVCCLTHCLRCNFSVFLDQLLRIKER